MTTPRVSIPADLAQAIHEYLLTRPMREVEGLVVALRQAETVEAEKPVRGDEPMTGPGDKGRAEPEKKP